MNTKILIIFLLSVLVCISCAGDSSEFSEMSKEQIDSLLTETAAKNMTITERMKFYSKFFLNTPYSFTCVGDGKDALLETYPLVNFKETNCMAYCEHVLALSISDSWDNFFNNLQQIRYKDGIIGMRTRNHYTMADWLPENDWLLQDVSRKVGGDFTRKVTRTISHRTFFEGKGITDLRYVKPDREITLDYVPKDVLTQVQNNFNTGDICALLFANKDDIFSAHMFMVMHDNEGKPFIRESSNSKMSTFDTPFDQWARRISDSNRYIGIAVMRVRDDLNKSGKIILPWEICALKANKNQ